MPFKLVNEKKRMEEATKEDPIMKLYYEVSDKEYSLIKAYNRIPGTPKVKFPAAYKYEDD